MPAVHGKAWRRSAVAVITSYSIHYTKLYDYLVDEDWRDRDPDAWLAAPRTEVAFIDGVPLDERYDAIVEGGPAWVDESTLEFLGFRNRQLIRVRWSRGGRNNFV